MRRSDAVLTLDSAMYPFMAVLKDGISLTAPMSTIALLSVRPVAECTVLQVVETVLAVLRPGDCWEDWTEHVPDRPYQDERYHISGDKLCSLGWYPRVNLEEAIRRIANSIHQNRQTAPSVSGESETT